MREIQLLVATVCVGVMLTSVRAEEESPAKFNVGGKVWIVDSSWKWPDSPRTKGDGFMYGLVASVDLPKNWWVSGQFLVGEMEFGEGGQDSTMDADLFAGYSFEWVDAGFGFRFINIHEQSAQEGVEDYECQIFGPSLYVATGSSFGDLPVGWYAGGALMFADLGDQESSDTKGEHFNLEGGLSFRYKQLSGTLGYRYRYRYLQDNDLTDMGPTASVSIEL